MEEIITTIKRLGHDGRGIAHVNGKTTFVFGALPDEEVAISYVRKKSRFDEAFVASIITPSPKRVGPNCKSFGTCGGCSLQHVEQNAQIEFKESVLLEQLKHFGHVAPENILPPLCAAPYGYRRKARFSVRYIEKKQRTLVGFREKHYPRFIADVDACEVIHPSLGQLFIPLQECLNGLENRNAIAQIEVAVGDEQTAIILRHLLPLSDEDNRSIIDFAKRHNLWLYLQPGNYHSIHKVEPKDEKLLTYAIADDITLHFHPCDFTQVNASINRQMIKQAIDLLKPTNSDVVLDLFCGIGNFSLPLAKKAGRVVGIEGDERLVKRAAMNAEINSITNAQFYTSDLTTVDDMLGIMRTSGCNKILIDPPRSGAKEVVENLDLKDIEAIVYVSCNPSTLARDAGILCARGFTLSHVGVMDMFTHTEHVEAMALFLPTRRVLS